MLCNAGNGESGLGVAGAHFDRHLLKLKLGSDAKAELRDELLVALDEKKKRSKNSALLLENYLLDASPQERVEPIYSLSSSHGPPVSISFDDICEAFAPVRDGIGRVLTEIREKAEREGHPIDKVILVGGFSQFPLVQQAVGEFFGEDVFNDPKLIDLVTLSRDDMAFAISYGACLVAADRVQVTEIYEHTIGIVAYSAQTGERTELELIRARRSLNALEETAFYVRSEDVV